jgi:hypothetical protein
MEDFRVFKDALIYTVCTEAVNAWMDSSEKVSLIFLIMIFTILVFISLQLNTAIKTTGAIYLPKTPLAFVSFFTGTVLNLVLQFQANLVTKLVVRTLAPGTSSIETIATFALLSIFLLWLMAESFKH